MSGSIGGDRISHSAVKDTILSFKDILKSYPAFKSLVSTGSTEDATRLDHGDIDLAVHLEGEDIKKVKKDFIEFLNSLPDDVTVPFRSGRNKGKKTAMYADIVTCQIPIVGFENLLVQVDCAIILSEIEQAYKKNFLDLPGEKQALLMGLARVILLSENPEKVFKRLGIKKLPELEKDQEFEFVLSPTGLTLRKVTISSDYKELSREDVWKSKDWSDVIKLFQDFNLEKSFDELLSDIAAKNYSDRCKQRIVGIVNSTLTIGPGEVGKPKGDNKERAKSKTTNVLGEVDLPEETKTVALYGGGFKPPHKMHFANAQKLSKSADRLIIFIGSKVREGVPITAEQSKDIWNIYKKYLPIPVEVRLSQKSPISDIYRFLENSELSDISFIVGKSQGEDEDKKFAYLLKRPDKYPNVTIKTLPILTDNEDKKFSATTLRKSIEIIKKGNWLPDCLDRDDARKVLEIILAPLEQQVVQEEFNLKLNKVLVETLGLKEASSGSPIAPSYAISSENRQKLSNLYKDLNSQIGDEFVLKFNISNIVIMPRYEDSSLLNKHYDPEQAFGSMNEEEQPEMVPQEFDYVPWIASYCKFLKKKGLTIDPLPKIVLNRENQKKGILDKTGYYVPEKNTITLYVDGRHPKDVLNTFSHEMIHREQFLEKKIGKISTSRISDDSNLLELEAEAYMKGRLYFREWIETLE